MIGIKCGDVCAYTLSEVSAIHNVAHLLCAHALPYSAYILRIKDQILQIYKRSQFFFTNLLKIVGVAC